MSSIAHVGIQLSSPNCIASEAVLCQEKDYSSGGISVQIYPSSADTGIVDSDVGEHMLMTLACHVPRAHIFMS